MDMTPPASLFQGKIIVIKMSSCLAYYHANVKVVLKEDVSRHRLVYLSAALEQDEDWRGRNGLQEALDCSVPGVGE